MFYFVDILYKQNYFSRGSVYKVIWETNASKYFIFYDENKSRAILKMIVRVLPYGYN